MIKSVSMLVQPLATKPLSSSIYIRALRCILCSLLLSMAAPLAIPLPFCPVPLVLQVQLCLLFAAIFGAREGLSIVLLFLLQGTLGAPVFAGGTSGFMCLLGPSGGYLIGYALGAFCTGKMVEIYRNQSMLAMIVGNFIVYIIATIHLSNFVSYQQAWLIGALPYIPFDLMKVVLLAKYKERYIAPRL